MSEKKDQTSDSSSQSTGAEIRSSSISYDGYMNFVNKMKNKNMSPEEFQRQTYYNVLHFFRAETPEISSSRILFVHELKNKLNIFPETHFEFEKKIQDEPLVKRWRNASKASDKKEEDLLEFQERLNAAPATIQDENAKPSSSSTSEDSLVPSWGQVSPQSLVGRLVKIRMPDEDDYAAMHIKDYNAETEMHHLVTDLSKTYTDPCDWIDIRHIPAEDIVWQDGHPRFPARKSSLKPGETILGTTSTSQDKKRITEVGKSASGIPIIKKLDRGKGIARA